MIFFYIRKSCSDIKESFVFCDVRKSVFDNRKFFNIRQGLHRITINLMNIPRDATFVVS